MARKWAPMDAENRFCEDKVITASGPIQEASADVILAIGPGQKEGILAINVTNIDISSGNETYDLILQGTNDATFATAANVTELLRKTFGKGSAFLPNSALKDRGVGRYNIPFSNEEAGETYKNVRLVAVVAGTTPTITLDAWLSID
jgi:hypothetical protein